MSFRDFLVGIQNSIFDLNDILTKNGLEGVHLYIFFLNRVIYVVLVLFWYTDFGFYNLSISI